MTKGEEQYCIEHNISFDDYRNGKSKKEKEEIKAQIRAKQEEERQRKKDSKKKDLTGIADWYQKLDLDENRFAIKSYDNICRFLEYYPDFIKDGKSIFSKNEFTGRYLMNGIPYTDDDINAVRNMCSKQINQGSKSDVDEAMKYVCCKNSHNPVKDAIEDILWDGQSRVEEFFIKTLSVKDTELNRVLTRKFFYAMMKRLYEPGCSFDNMVIITDPTQGTGKSKILYRLLESVGLDDYYLILSDADLSEKDTMMLMCENWVVCLDELASTLKKDTATLKSLIQQKSLRFRAPYDRSTVDHKCAFIFYGNTNEAFFLKDYSSENVERRFWIMEADGVPHDAQWFDENVPMNYCRQILAEAKYIYDNDKMMKIDFNVLNSKERKMMLDVQMNHKTSRDNDSLSYAIYNVLNGLYTRDKFNSYEDFRREAKGKLTNDDGFEYGGTLRINRIPCTWVRILVNELKNKSVTTQYITSLLRGDWVVSSNEYYAGKNHRCYIRQKPH